MDYNKRIIIALVLSLAVFFLYSIYMERYFPKSTAKEEAGKPAGFLSWDSLKERVGWGGVDQHGAPEETGAGKTPLKTSAVKEEFITIETPLYKARISNLGAGIKNWELKNYRAGIEKTSGLIDLAATSGSGYLISKFSSRGSLKEMLFKPSKSQITVASDSAEELLFSWTSPGGIRVEKTYGFKGDNYTIAVATWMTNLSGRDIKADIITEMQRVYKKEEMEDSYHHGPIRKEGDKIKRQKNGKGAETGMGMPQGFGLEDKYFLIAVGPEKADDGGNAEPLTWESLIDADNAAAVSFSMPFILKPGEQTAFNYTAYLGPKEYNRLNALGLGGAIEFGWFAMLAKPSLVVLNFFERFLKNYGLAIIVLTVIIKIIFYPLTKYGLNSMKQIQSVQPQMNALREKYKNDKEKMNKELFDLYKRYKVNPLGGCLPMLVQIPVFIALYEALMVAIELRHAPFVGWLADLSAKDPYYITPVLMGITMFIQQKMTPTTMDPMQEKMMLIMPVVMTVVFLNFPSGLVIYWLVNNILSIAQQWQIYKGQKKLTIV